MMLSEAAVIAIANAVEYSARFGIEFIKSQPPDVQAEFWKLHLADAKEARAFWRKLVGLPD